MSSGGWIKLYRQSVFSPELCDDISAYGFWCWLLAQAAHKPTAVYRGKAKVRVDLQPGQVVISARSVPGLSEKRARTLLKKFEQAGMIRADERRTTGRTITIINWALYQQDSIVQEDQRANEKANNGRTRGARGAHEGRTAQEDKEYKNIDSSAEADLPLSDLGRASAPRDRYPPFSKLPKNGRGPHYPEEFSLLWQTYPVRPEDTKPGCYKHWRSWVVDRRVDPATILAGAESYAKAKAMDDHRFGLLRWCREGLWITAEPEARKQTPSSRIQSGYGAGIA